MALERKDELLKILLLDWLNFLVGDIDGISRIKENGIIAIIHGQQSEKIVSIIEALLKGGIRTVAVTADTPKITFVIEEAVKEYGDVRGPLPQAKILPTGE